MEHHAHHKPWTRILVGSVSALTGFFTLIHPELNQGPHIAFGFATLALGALLLFSVALDHLSGPTD